MRLRRCIPAPADTEYLCHLLRSGKSGIGSGRGGRERARRAHDLDGGSRLHPVMSADRGRPATVRAAGRARPLGCTGDWQRGPPSERCDGPRSAWRCGDADLQTIRAGVHQHMRCLLCGNCHSEQSAWPGDANAGCINTYMILSWRREMQSWDSAGGRTLGRRQLCTLQRGVVGAAAGRRHLERRCGEGCGLLRRECGCWYQA